MIKKLNHFKLSNELGRGGNGIVYKAFDIRLKRNVAIKILNPHPEYRKKDIRRFLLEAQAASSLNHPNICTVFEIGKQGNNFYIIMELVEGKTLRQVLEESKKFPEIEVIEVAIQVCQALSAAHKNAIIHRDIKPDNIMISEEEFVKVMDFGLAKLKQVEKKLDSGKFNQSNILSKNISLKTSVSTLLGTTNYMSPEQINHEPVDERSDIFSLGIVLYEMSTGSVPFEGNDSTEVLRSIIEDEPKPLEHYNSEICSGLKDIICKALKKKPENRFQNMKEILSALNKTKEEIFEQRKQRISNEKINLGKPRKQKKLVALFIMIILLGIVWFSFFEKPFLLTENLQSIGLLNNNNKYGIAVAPFWSVDESAAQAGKNFQKLIIEKLNEQFKNERMIKIKSDEKIQIIQSHDEAYAYGNKLDVAAIVWGSVTDEVGVFKFYSKITFLPYTRTNTIQSNDPLLIKNNFYQINLDKFDDSTVDNITNFISAKYYLGEKDYNKALSSCSKIDSLDPDNMILKAEIFHSQSKHSKAVDVYKKIISHYPNLSKSDIVYGGISSSFKMLNEHDLAYKYSLKAINSDTTVPGNYNATAILCMEMGKYEEAISYFIRAIQLDYQNNQFHARLGQCYFLMEQYDEALKSFDRAIKLNDRTYRCFYDLGTVYHYMKQFENAIKYYKKAIRADRARAWVYYNLGLVYLNQGKYKNAIRVFKKAIKLRPEVKDFYNGLAISFMVKGELSEAVKYSEKAAEVNPDNPSTRLIYFLNLFRNNHQAEAISMLSEFRKIMDNKNWFSSIIDLYLGKGNETDVFEASTHKFPHTNKGQTCEAYYYIGMAHLFGLRHEISTNEDTLKAKQLFQKSLDTGIMDFLEYELANIELKKMKNED